MTTVSTEHIEKTPGVCGGRARIAGHSIRVMDVVALQRVRGLSAEEVAAVYPSITLADVYAALVYALDHPDEIEADFADERRWEEYARSQPSKLRAALAARPELREKLGG